MSSLAMTTPEPSAFAPSKAPTAFRTISEVANKLEVPQHVLRFWESKFPQIRPHKGGGGRRYYRADDVALISNIKELLYNQGMTIRGVQKLLKETGRAGIVRPSEMATTVVPVAKETEDGPAVTKIELASRTDTSGLSLAARREMEAVLVELKAMRDFLRQSGV